MSHKGIFTVIHVNIDKYGSLVGIDLIDKHLSRIQVDRIGKDSIANINADIVVFH